MDTAFLMGAAKQALEVAHAEGDNMIPMVLLEREDGSYDIVALLGGHPYDMLMASLHVLREAEPVAMSLTVDSYSFRTDDEVGGQRLRSQYGNSLAAMFEAGIPGVSECLMVNIVTPTSVHIEQLPYTRTADGIMWDEPLERDGAKFSGRLIDAMKLVWA